METLAVLQSLLEAGPAAIFLLATLVMWRAYQREVQEHINDLRRLAGLGGDLLATSRSVVAASPLPQPPTRSLA